MSCLLSPSVEKNQCSEVTLSCVSEGTFFGCEFHYHPVCTWWLTVELAFPKHLLYHCWETGVVVMSVWPHPGVYPLLVVPKAGGHVNISVLMETTDGKWSHLNLNSKCFDWGLSTQTSQSGRIWKSTGTVTAMIRVLLFVIIVTTQGKEPIPYLIKHSSGM